MRELLAGLREPMTNAELNRAFLFFNIHYFDGKLQKPAQIRFADTKDRDGAVLEDETGCRLLIHSGLKRFPNAAVVALLHEMAHLKHRVSIPEPHVHGMIFQAEIVRLFNSGAYEGLL